MYRALKLLIVFVSLSFVARSQTISYLEYFINSDPGYGNGTAVALTPNDSVTAIIPIDISSFSAGFHSIYTRVKDINGKWSTTTTRKFYFLPRLTFSPIITQAEYFIDSDPGIGAGTSISITPNDSIGVIIPLDISSYTEGFHSVYARVKDDNGLWSTTTVKKFYFLPRSTFTPIIAQAEYFIDADPGIGAGTSISITPNDSIGTIVPLDISSFTEGFHAIYARVKDDNGRWSTTTSKKFYFLPRPTFNPVITQAEYFIDNEPGLGAGTPFTITPNDSVGAIIPLDISSFAEGFHAIYARVKDDNGRWSTTTSKKFYFLPRPTFNPVITQAEYFIDNEPGLGAGTPITITPNDSVGAIIPLDISSFAEGFHSIYSRVKDDNGRWSTTTAKRFYFLPRASFNPVITQAEYYIDSDPGIGVATQLPISPNDSISNLFPVDVTSLSMGFHSMNIRVKDDNGRWSLISSRQFYHDPLFRLTGNIAYVEYYVDTDPGYGNAAQIPITPNDSILSNLTLDLGYLSTGNHYLNVRVKDSYQRWSTVAFDLIKFGTPVNLKSGWNIFSASVLPENTDMQVIVDKLIIDGNLIKVQDELGNALEYVVSSWVNNIPAFDNALGYKIKVNADCQFDVIGQQISLPFSVPLSTGWNIAGYPMGDTLKSSDVFQPMIADGSLSKVQSETGAAIENLDVIGWIDNIKDLIQGEGYMVRMNSPNSLTFGATKGVSSFVPYNIPASVFNPSWVGKGYNHMNIYLSDATINDLPLEVGDQIGVFDGETCVGIYTFTNQSRLPLNVVATTDDPLTKEKDGFKPGNSIIFKVWSNKHNDFCSEIRVQTLEGHENMFVSNGTTIFELRANNITTDVPTEEALTSKLDFYPNPSADKVTIQFFLEQKGHVKMSIYDLIGNQKGLIVDKVFENGLQKLDWYRSENEISAGIYVVRITTNNYTYSKPLVLVNR